MGLIQRRMRLGDLPYVIPPTVVVVISTKSVDLAIRSMQSELLGSHCNGRVLKKLKKKIGNGSSARLKWGNSGSTRTAGSRERWHLSGSTYSWVRGDSEELEISR